jgi:hypothetical protein
MLPIFFDEKHMTLIVRAARLLDAENLFQQSDHLKTFLLPHVWLEFDWPLRNGNSGAIGDVYFDIFSCNSLQ